jgi:hypothetical protein
MSRFTDIYLSEVPQGSLVYPSSSARQSGNGGYMLEGLGANRFVNNDSDIFPAVVINPSKGTLVTPTGLKNLARYSLVSVIK